MEIKEAIAILARIQEPEAWEPQITKEAWQALEMAKEALVKESQGLAKDSVKDLPDISVGNCSEIPNSSDLIGRKDAIDALGHGAMVNYQAAGHDNGLVKAINIIKGLPPAQPEASILTVKVALDPEEMERVVREIKNTPVVVLPSVQPKIIYCKDCEWFGNIGCAIRIVEDSDKPTENDFCSFAKRRTDE